MVEKTKASQAVRGNGGSLDAIGAPAFAAHAMVPAKMGIKHEESNWGTTIGEGVVLALAGAPNVLRQSKAAGNLKIPGGLPVPATS